jgi:hypothetical protein
MIDLAGRLAGHQGDHPITTQLHLLSPSAGTPLYDHYSDQLVLDNKVDSALLCGALETNSFRPGYDEVFRMIASDPVLGAPFHRYKTPSFESKLRCVQELHRTMEIKLAERVLGVLSSR